jgi:hypothetical protein
VRLENDSLFTSGLFSFVCCAVSVLTLLLALLLTIIPTITATAMATPAATDIDFFLPEPNLHQQAFKHHLKFLPATAKDFLESIMMEEFK